MTELFTEAVTRAHDEASTPDLGQKIKLARRAAGLTQTDLAEAAGITAAYVSRIEDGQRRPTLPVLDAFSRRCAVTLDDLLSVELPNNGHEWYHTGGDVDSKADNDLGRRGRLCQRCGFREGWVKDLTCTGDRRLYASAHDEGFLKGERMERDRMRKLLGL